MVRGDPLDVRQLGVKAARLLDCLPRRPQRERRVKLPRAAGIKPAEQLAIVLDQPLRDLPAQCEPLLGAFCAEAELPTTADEFVDQVRLKLAAKAAEVDAGYPKNTDLTIDRESGQPTLKRRKGKNRTRSAIVLEQRIKQRMPERTVLEIVARTAYWIGWHLHFGPASGSDPKLRNPLVRYLVTTFTYGSRMGAAQAARHMRGISAHELGATYIRHFTVEKLDRASVDVINEYLRLDITKAWGEARSVAADGTMVDTLLENLLAERHIRYGGYGGIAYHHVADNYIALFSHFIPCGGLGGRLHHRRAPQAEIRREPGHGPR